MTVGGGEAFRGRAALHCMVVFWRSYSLSLFLSLFTLVSLSPRSLLWRAWCLSLHCARVWHLLSRLWIYGSRIPFCYLLIRIMCAFFLSSGVTCGGSWGLTGSWTGRLTPWLLSAVCVCIYKPGFTILYYGIDRYGVGMVGRYALTWHP